MLGSAPLIAYTSAQVNRCLFLLQKLAAASKIAPNKAHLALSLVGYAGDVSQAMAYVFGDTMICDDAESAKAVTFNKAIMLKSVTVQGDVYDPSGLLSGGSAPSGSGTLLKVQELNVAQGELARAKATLAEIEREEAAGRDARDAWRRLERELEIKGHELSLLEDQLGGSNAARVCPFIPFVHVQYFCARSHPSYSYSDLFARLAPKWRRSRRPLRN